MYFSSSSRMIYSIPLMRSCFDSKFLSLTLAGRDSRISYSAIFIEFMIGSESDRKSVV